MTIWRHENRAGVNVGGENVITKLEEEEESRRRIRRSYVKT